MIITCSWFVPDLFLTFSWHVHDLFNACPWLFHGMLMTYFLLVKYLELLTQLNITTWFATFHSLHERLILKSWTLTFDSPQCNQFREILVWCQLYQNFEENLQHYWHFDMARLTEKCRLYFLPIAKVLKELSSQYTLYSYGNYQQNCRLLMSKNVT